MNILTNYQRNNLRVVGHSLGTMISGELSYKFTNKAAKLIALDPPSESKINTGSKLSAIPYMGFNQLSRFTDILNRIPSLNKIPSTDRNLLLEALGNTNYKVNNQQERKPYREYAQSSYAYYGKFSLAGNREFAKTANESYEMDFHKEDYFADLGNEHQLVHQTFKNMVRDIELVNRDYPYD